MRFHKPGWEIKRNSVGHRFLMAYQSFARLLTCMAAELENASGIKTIQSILK